MSFFALQRLKKHKTPHLHRNFILCIYSEFLSKNLAGGVSGHNSLRDIIQSIPHD